MQAFEVLWLRWLLVMILSGLGLSVALFLGFYLPRRTPRPSDREKVERYPSDISIGNKGIPLLLLLVYFGILIFIVVYTTFAWLGRFNY